MSRSFPPGVSSRRTAALGSLGARHPKTRTHLCGAEEKPAEAPSASHVTSRTRHAPEPWRRRPRFRGEATRARPGGSRRASWAGGGAGHCGGDRALPRWRPPAAAAQRAAAKPVRPRPPGPGEPRSPRSAWHWGSVAGVRGEDARACGTRAAGAGAPVHRSLGWAPQSCPA